MSLLRDELIQHQVEWLNAQTEAICWKAIAKGVGYRVWRSNPIYEPWPSTVVTWKFAILAPGEHAPGAGVVFGPFSSDRENSPCPPSP